MDSATRIVGHVVVVGPRMDSQGGIASVNRTLCEADFFGIGSDGLEVTHHASTRDGSRLLRALFAVQSLLRFGLSSRNGPWMVHAHMAFRGSFWRKAAYGWVARWRGGRVVFQIHPTAFWDYYERGGATRRMIIRATLRRADELIAITNDMREKLGHIVPSIPISMLPNPIGPTTPETPSGRDPSTVAFVGWLVPEKGVSELVDAVARLRARHPDIRLVFAGSKDDGRLRTHVTRMGLDDIVEFPGWLTPDRVGSLLGRATVLALPSHSEGVPMAILEALAHGTPIVASTVGGIPEVLRHEQNALLVPPKNVDALTAALERVLSDPSLRERMGAANREAAKAFDVNGVVAALRTVYRRVLAPD